MGRPILLFLSGAAIGAAVALLTAPMSGKDTRRKIKKVSGDLAKQASRVAPAIQHAYKNASKAGKEAFTQAWNDSAMKSSSAGHQSH